MHTYISDTVTLVVLTGWLAFVAWRITKGDRHVVIFPIMIFYAFFALPVALDLIAGEPKYVFFPGLQQARDDEVASVVYNVYLILIPTIMWWVGRAHALGRRTQIAANMISGTWMTRVFYIVLLAPLIVLARAPQPALYAQYGAALHASFYGSREVQQYHGIITFASFLSVLGAFALLLSRPRLTPSFVVAIAVAMLPAVWLQGKRALVALALFVVLYAIWQRRLVRPRQMVATIVVALVSLTVYSALYQSAMREHGAADIRYDSWRLDYGRDGVGKLAIFCELHPESGQILEYRGQSLLFDLALLIPRDLWPDKPWSYPTYVTFAALGAPVSSINWGLTTSWLDELIANCGWLGMIIAPLSLGLLCRIGDALNDDVVKGLTALLASLLLVVHFGLIFPVAYLWLGAVAWKMMADAHLPRESAARTVFSAAPRSPGRDTHGGGAPGGQGGGLPRRWSERARLRNQK